MKKCAHCQFLNDDNAKFCNNCGAQLQTHDDQQINQQQDGYSKTAQQQYQNPNQYKNQWSYSQTQKNQEEQKRSKKCMKWMFSIVGVCVVVAIIGCIITPRDTGNIYSTVAGNGTNAETTTELETTTESTTEPKNNIGKYKVELKDYYVTDDYEDKILVVTYSFTNNYDEPRSWIYSIDDIAYQNGVELGPVYSSYGIDGYDFTTYNSNIKPGVTVEVQNAYVLYDETTDVEINLSLWPSDNVELTYTIDL